MGKCFNALQKAEKEHQKNNIKAPMPDESYGLIESGSSHAELVPKRMTFLKSNLLRLNQSESTSTIIMFTGTSEKCGTTTTTAYLGTALAKEAGYRVLLVDANVQNPNLHSIFNIEPQGGICDIIAKQDRSIAFDFKRVGPANLYFLPCGNVSAESKRHFDSPRFVSFLKFAREKFHFVILDTATINNSLDSQIICSKVDGVVMVVKAGQTRRQVAEWTKKEIEDAGGKIFGVVINRRKYYIPSWIYKRL